ncbi:hypothetical protein BJ741DRAFT_581089 [Chytriomyces cf. hyalinus JEL632]|nr:hypothetical protein BJ741DRAFT_581089 [Chytriomyces cf. hyalinus JEL632]
MCLILHAARGTINLSSNSGLLALVIRAAAHDAGMTSFDWRVGAQNQMVQKLRRSSSAVWWASRVAVELVSGGSDGGAQPAYLMGCPSEPTSRLHIGLETEQLQVKHHPNSFPFPYIVQSHGWSAPVWAHANFVLP